MGQKVHPIGFRLGVNVGNRHVKEWQGKWYADKDYTKFLHVVSRASKLGGCRGFAGSAAHHGAAGRGRCLQG